jgi:predicted heme/steroid binding protein
MSASSSTPAKAEQGESRVGDNKSAADRQSASGPRPEAREFTSATLAGFNGADPDKPVLIGYRGRVYDVSGRFMWMNGRHFWLRAGRDLTADLREAPHGEEMLNDVPCVGVLVADNDPP